MGKSLVIVESPAKARTLQKYLGRDFLVKASVGHVIDLPPRALGVDIEHDFTPQYVTIKGKGPVIKDLQKAAGQADTIFLASDPDREGEAIAWHIAQLLAAARRPIRRALFHELTKKAILAALAEAADLNQDRFEAQQARRILDRLVGYQISPLLWDKVRRGLSAGRVQSVAVRMICDREEAIEAFRPEEYWTIGAGLTGPRPPAFVAQVDKEAGKKIRLPDETAALRVVADLRPATFVVRDLDRKEKKRHPSPPFITSTLQQDANRKLRFSAKKTMTLAQRLYEGIELGDEGPVGLITYMRTDSVRTSAEAIAEVRTLIDTRFGKDHLPGKPVFYRSKKGAQDAHEAIRPTQVALTPEEVAPLLDRDLAALYSLIWKRFVASQMAPALYDQTVILIEAGRYELKATGSVLRFPGFLAVYEEGRDEGAEEEAALPLPALAKGETLTLTELTPKQHFTQPPPRYTEATLVRALEENGVGRPSTYATILSTIVDKEYVAVEERKLRPTDLGRLVNGLLVQHFPGILDVEFTAGMEEHLDQVEDGTRPWLAILKEFYGPFAESLERAREEMQSVRRRITPTGIPCPACGAKLVVRWGRNGEFLACENYPTCKHTADFQRQTDGTIVPLERPSPEPSQEMCDKCGRPMVFKQGRLGRFLACSGYPECKSTRALGTGVPCPASDCDGELVARVSKRGKPFFGCNRYPKCTFALWDKPVARSCPACSAPYVVEKVSKDGRRRLRCAQRSCRWSEAVPTSSPDEANAAE
ncbi:MAG: type I DNA topoisomerase [Thermodesulfobacteriota bacterium]